MNEDTIIKSLKKLSNIKPDQDFIGRSRPVILAVSPLKNISPLRLIFSMRSAIVLVVMILVVAGVFGYFKTNRNHLASVDSDLLIEADQLNFDIHLKEAKYFDESIKKVADALDRAAKDKNDSQNDLDLNQKINDLLKNIF